MIHWSIGWLVSCLYVWLNDWLIDCKIILLCLSHTQRTIHKTHVKIFKKDILHYIFIYICRSRNDHRSNHDNRWHKKWPQAKCQWIVKKIKTPYLACFVFYSKYYPQTSGILVSHNHNLIYPLNAKWQKISSEFKTKQQTPNIMHLTNILINFQENFKSIISRLRKIDNTAHSDPPPPTHTYTRTHTLQKTILREIKNFKFTTDIGLSNLDYLINEANKII